MSEIDHAGRIPKPNFVVTNPPGNRNKLPFVADVVQGSIYRSLRNLHTCRCCPNSHPAALSTAPVRWRCHSSGGHRMSLRSHDFAPGLYFLTFPARSLRDQFVGHGEPRRIGWDRATNGATIYQLPEAQWYILRHDLDDHLCRQIQLPLLFSSPDPARPCRHFVLANRECRNGSCVGLLHCGRFHYLPLFWLQSMWVWHPIQVERLYGWEPI